MIYVIGAGPGDSELITIKGKKIIEKCSTVIGGKRLICNIKGKNTIEIGTNFKEVKEYIIKNEASEDIAVLASGDPSIFSITGWLYKNISSVKFEVVPGIGSMQYFCTVLGTDWRDIVPVSTHGKSLKDIEKILFSNSRVMIFAGGDNTPDKIAGYLIKTGYSKCNGTVGERLSYPDQKIFKGSLEEISKTKFSGLSLLLVEREKEIEPEIKDINNIRKKWTSCVPGIPDSMFIRGSVPMTKEEIRVLTLSKLRLDKDSIVYDIGAGTGSVSVECALLCSEGKVYAVEKTPQGIELINKNKDKFSILNIETIEGEAPDVILGRQCPDRVFIGGSGGRIEDIIKWISGFDKRPVVAANAVTIESACEILKMLEQYGFEDVEAVMASVSKSQKAGTRHLMKALNPVYIISGR